MGGKDIFTRHSTPHPLSDAVDAEKNGTHSDTPITEGQDPPVISSYSGA